MKFEAMGLHAGDVFLKPFPGRITMLCEIRYALFRILNMSHPNEMSLFFC